MNLFKISKLDFMNTVKNPILFFYNAIFPLVSIGIMGFITKGSYGSKVTSYDYYGVTMMLYTVVSIGLTTANTFMEKNIKKGNVRLIYSPTHTSCIFLSKILSTFVMGSIFYSILLILEQKVLNINLGGSNFIYVLVIIIAFTLLMCSFGALMCCIFRSEEAANKFQSPLTLLMAVFGGLFFPVDSLGKTVVKISYLSPFKWINECILRIIYSSDFSLFIPVLFSMIIGSAILMILCKITFRPEAYV